MRSMTFLTATAFIVFSLCAWNSGTKKEVSMSSWVKLHGSDGRDINVNEMGEFHLVNSVGKLYIYEGPEWKEIKDTYGDIKIYAENMGYKAKQNGNTVFTWERHPYQTTNGTKYTEPQWGWLLQTAQKDIAVNDDRKIWLIDGHGDIHSGVFNTKMQGSDGVRIAAGGGQVWLINTVGKIYRQTNPNNPKASWEQMPGNQGRDITVTNDGEVFLVTTYGLIFQWKTDKWVKLDGSDGWRIAANAHKIALVNTDGEIYTRNY